MTEAGTTYIIIPKPFFGKNYSAFAPPACTLSGDSRQFSIMAYLYSTIPLRKMTFLVGLLPSQGKKTCLLYHAAADVLYLLLLAIRR